ncbi:MAG: hypothetical protein Q8P67_08810, partial [archaeon]|nr:hypothetical protein [archaeon]
FSQSSSPPSSFYRSPTSSPPRSSSRDTLSSQGGPSHRDPFAEPGTGGTGGGGGGSHSRTSTPSTATATAQKGAPPAQKVIPHWSLSCYGEAHQKSALAEEWSPEEMRLLAIRAMRNGQLDQFRDVEKQKIAGHIAKLRSVLPDAAGSQLSSSSSSSAAVHQSARSHRGSSSSGSAASFDVARFEFGKVPEMPPPMLR